MPRGVRVVRIPQTRVSPLRKFNFRGNRPIPSAALPITGPPATSIKSFKSNSEKGGVVGNTIPGNAPLKIKPKIWEVKAKANSHINNNSFKNH